MILTRFTILCDLILGLSTFFIPVQLTALLVYPLPRYRGMFHSVFVAIPREDIGLIESNMAFFIAWVRTMNHHLVSRDDSAS